MSDVQAPKETTRGGAPYGVASPYPLLIGGKQVLTDETFVAVDPSVGQPWATLSQADNGHVEQAVAAAGTAFGQPLGGIKASGYGREMSAETLLEHSTPKTVAMRLSTQRPQMFG